MSSLFQRCALHKSVTKGNWRHHRNILSLFSLGLSYPFRLHTAIKSRVTKGLFYMAFQQRRGGRPQGRPQSSGNRSFGGRRGGGSRGPAKKYIHPSKFINKAVSKADEVVYESKHKFADFPFGAELHHNISTKGYVTPSAIQDQAIPHIIEGRDVIGLANTGTGKTAAFLLPII